MESPRDLRLQAERLRESAAEAESDHLCSYAEMMRKAAEDIEAVAATLEIGAQDAVAFAS